MKNNMNMNNMKKGIAIICLFLFATTMFIRCDDGGEVEPDDKGSVNFEMTDAPIDDANVQGAFVTVASIKVDGENYGGFSGKQTIDLLAYQNGFGTGLACLPDPGKSYPLVCGKTRLH